ncbi:phosphatidylinositol N-acetylglucosaminyltransferase subunit H-like [Brevipalpus obovatus]|uniref:phosphatidylinositol N-acetylglucosaminyltransferase subunit H-like n=1 Tax=Brevipalpus obovatus TaxID=246614 RepID=UPI003D9DD896
MSCFHLSRQFANAKDQPIEVHIQRHFNYIQIKIVKNESFAKSVVLIPLCILVIIVYCLHYYLEDLPVYLSFTLGGFGFLFSYFLLCNLIITEESVLIIRSIHGVQYNYRNLLGKVTSKFISSTNIIINEATTMSKVVSYLAVLEVQSSQLSTSQQIHPIFNHLVPRIDCIKLVYSSLYDFLENKQGASQQTTV